MKLLRLKPVGYVMILLLVVYSCSTAPVEEATTSVTGRLTTHSGCKEFKSASLYASAPDSLSCIHYQYHPVSGMLTIEHENAGFNCCPDSLFCVISLAGDTLVINEKQKKDGCKCNCLYDLTIEVKGILPGKLVIKMAEPFLGDQKPLILKADLSVAPTGSLCVERLKYPWGVN